MVYEFTCNICLPEPKLGSILFESSVPSKKILHGANVYFSRHVIRNHADAQPVKFQATKGLYAIYTGY